MALGRYRRVRRAARRPLRRSGPYRRRRRGFFRRPRMGKGVFRVKLTRFVSITQNVAKTSQMGLDVRPVDFSEFGKLAGNFEAFRFTRARVRVLPQQNVSNNSSSLMPAYCVFPWHRPLPADSNFNQFLSIDRSKVFRGTGVGKMSFVPSIIASVGTSAGGTLTMETKWKPRLELVNDGTANTVVFYTGAIGFQGIPEAPEGAKAHYNIIIDKWGTFYNQKTLD
uniref:Capsid protein n=1 Tax=Dragonfly associated cyclovirus 4 TaxID=1234882 RepID=M9V5C6_9CIRC|nr:capsid protein [Dragonfly associated cyclovirus 4]